MSPAPRSLRLLLIGLDGATFDVLDPLVAEGVMPHLGRLMAGGARAVLRSTVHPLTPPAWATLMTGRSPGNHGVFDFIRVDRDGPEPSYTLATSADLRAPTIWQVASEAGLRATTLNFPVMFPARPIEGVVIPGYVPWSYLGRAIYPREAARRLRERGVLRAREMSTDWQHERRAVQGLAANQLEEWVEFHIARERRWFEVLLALMEEEPSELTAVLLDGVDRIQHLCLHLIDPATRDRFAGPDDLRARAATLRYFRDLDGMIAEMVRRAGPEALTLLVSDHGFTRSGERIFYANTWLEGEGLLAWKPGTPLDQQGRVALDENTEAGTLIDWGRTRAYALSSSSNAIFIRRAREGGGPGVAPEAYEGFRADLAARLLALRDPRTGRPVVARALTREEAFPGAHAALAPDLTLQLHDFSFISVLRTDAPLKDRRVPYATHHPDGILVASGPGVAAGRALAPLAIADVAPTVLHALGLAVPEDMEGAVAEEAFTAEHRSAHPPRRASVREAAAGEAPARALPEEAQAQIRERLRSLGYL